MAGPSSLGHTDLRDGKPVSELVGDSFRNLIITGIKVEISREPYVAPFYSFFPVGAKYFVRDCDNNLPFP